MLFRSQGSHFPTLSLPKSFLGAGLVVGVILAIYKLRFLSLIFLSPLIFIFIFQNNQFPGKNWEVTNCNVGQGDGLVLNLGHGQAILIDAGPDEKKIDKCLRMLGIRSIPLLVLTHFHADHVGGLKGALANRNIGQVWLTSYTAPFLQREEVLKDISGKKEYFPIAGDEINFKSSKGSVKLRALWPKSSFKNYQSLPGDGSSINNSSIAILITIDKLKIFATGDIEPPVQKEIFNTEYFGAVDILKVPHHGSAYQFAPLLRRCRPRVSLISVGADNRYGHPATKTIALLQEIGSKVLRTDKDGAIAVDPSLSIRTKKSEWWDVAWS